MDVKKLIDLLGRLPGRNVIYAILGFLLAWFGSFLINLIRSPFMLIRELKSQLEDSQRSDLVIESAKFCSSRGPGEEDVKKQLESAKRDGLTIVASGDALKCDPDRCDDYKNLIVTYRFQGQGPFKAERAQNCPFPLVLPQDRYLLKQIDEKNDLYLKEHEVVKAYKVAFRDSLTLLRQQGVPETNWPILRLPGSTTHENSNQLPSPE